MELSDILLLGDPRLYLKAYEVKKSEVEQLTPVFHDMLNLILKFRARYGKGRAIAAPQIGITKRVICMQLDNPYILINPVLENLNNEMFELRDDCMSFPNLLVKIKRHKSCLLRYRDENWKTKEWSLKDDLSGLLQHEYDHLNGILATQRAIDSKSYSYFNL